MTDEPLRSYKELHFFGLKPQPTLRPQTQTHLHHGRRRFTPSLSLRTTTHQTRYERSPYRLVSFEEGILTDGQSHLMLLDSKPQKVNANEDGNAQAQAPYSSYDTDHMHRIHLPSLILGMPPSAVIAVIFWFPALVITALGVASIHWLSGGGVDGEKKE